jgi:hypothetical protein
MTDAPRVWPLSLQVVCTQVAAPSVNVHIVDRQDLEKACAPNRAQTVIRRPLPRSPRGVVGPGDLAVATGSGSDDRRRSVEACGPVVKEALRTLLWLLPDPVTTTTRSGPMMAHSAYRGRIAASYPVMWEGAAASPMMRMAIPVGERLSASGSQRRPRHRFPRRVSPIGPAQGALTSTRPPPTLTERRCEALRTLLCLPSGSKRNKIAADDGT